ncbi:GSCOCG00006743001-RA-CDS [Cotesia congregata]|nr:GSCOCG00006743001-RA-CDS [Cotesia congregata]
MVMFCLRKLILRDTVSCYTKNIIYRSAIAPHLDYCSSLMLNFNENKLDELQKVQNRAMRLILGVNKYTSIKSMLLTLGMLNVRQRIMYNCCIFIHKIILN